VTFRRGVADLDKPRSGVFEVGLLPDSEKERLARSLLAEFGATHVRVGGDGEELIHGCLLPFGNHSDQDLNPTASLNWKKLTYNCLGCGAGGGLIWFIGLCRDESGERARKWLEDQTGTGADEQSLASLLDYFDAVYQRQRHVDAPMPRMDAKVLTPWLAIHPYMTEQRGIPEDTLMAFRVGYGVLRVRVGANQFVDSHRIVIPHFWRDTLVGWQSRRLVKDDGTSKYLSSPDFPKDRTIFNYDARAREVVVVESPMSVLSKAHLDPHIEATFGGSTPDKQVRLLSMHRKVVLFMDNDEAGWNATRRLGDALEAYSSVWVASNPYAADPADLDDEAYMHALDEAVPYALWSQPATLEAWAA
jgi:DNA primase